MTEKSSIDKLFELICNSNKSFSLILTYLSLKLTEIRAKGLEKSKIKHKFNILYNCVLNIFSEEFVFNSIQINLLWNQNFSTDKKIGFNFSVQIKKIMSWVNLSSNLTNKTIKPMNEWFVLHLKKLLKLFA